MTGHAGHDFFFLYLKHFFRPQQNTLILSGYFFLFSVVFSDFCPHDISKHGTVTIPHVLMIRHHV